MTPTFAYGDFEKTSLFDVLDRIGVDRTDERLTKAPL